MEREKVSVTDEKGNIIEAEILFTYEANGDQYAFYVVEDTVYAARIKNPEEEANWILEKVEEDEWKLLEKIFDEWSKENEEN